MTDLNNGLGNIKEQQGSNSLHQNSFYLLEVTTRNNRRSIVESAEEKSLILDESLCTKARSDLTNPKNRLISEISWLSGISPKRASDLISALEKCPETILEQDSIPSLTRANLLASALKRIVPENNANAWTDWLYELALEASNIDIEQVVRDINEDRSISGFPMLTSMEDVEDVISNQKRYYVDTAKSAVNELPSEKLVEVLTDLVESATEDGEEHAFPLIDDMIDTYEIEAQNFLNVEAENVYKLIDSTRLAAVRGLLDRVPPLVNKIDSTVRNWDRVAQPIQVSMKSRGLDHQMSSDLAYSIRGLAIELFNKFDLIQVAQQLTETLQEVFAELPQMVEKLEEDVDALEEIAFSREEAKRDAEKKAEEITYSAEIGAIVKNTLSISPEGVSWKNKRIPLDDVTRVRWGATRHSINGIPSGTTHTIFFGDKRQLLKVETRKEVIYNQFIDKLWSAVCVRLWIDMLDDLKRGDSLYFGEIKIDDTGAEVKKRGFLGRSEKVYAKWSQLQTWSSNGHYVIGLKNNDKAYSSASYQDIDNVHILSAAIRTAFKNGVDRLSDMFN